MATENALQEHVSEIFVDTTNKDRSESFAIQKEELQKANVTALFRPDRKGQEDDIFGMIEFKKGVAMVLSRGPQYWSARFPDGISKMELQKFFHIEESEARGNGDIMYDYRLHHQIELDSLVAALRHMNPEEVPITKKDYMEDMDTIYTPSHLIKQK